MVTNNVSIGKATNTVVAINSNNITSNLRINKIIIKVTKHPIHPLPIFFLLSPKYVRN